jgi:PIN domain nuclease of toxin-antitoxin system
MAKSRKWIKLRGMAQGEIAKACEALALEGVVVDTGIAMVAAQLAGVGKPLGLSLGDRLCLATALSR